MCPLERATAARDASELRGPWVGSPRERHTQSEHVFVPRSGASRERCARACGGRNAVRARTYTSMNHVFRPVPRRRNSANTFPPHPRFAQCTSTRQASEPTSSIEPPFCSAIYVQACFLASGRKRSLSCASRGRLPLTIQAHHHHNRLVAAGRKYMSSRTRASRLGRVQVRLLTRVCARRCIVSS